MADDSKKQIVDFAIKELQKAIADLQSGKVPTVPQNLKSIFNKLNEANQKLNKKEITEEDMNRVLEEVAKKVEK